MVACLSLTLRLSLRLRLRLSLSLSLNLSLSLTLTLTLVQPEAKKKGPTKVGPEKGRSSYMFFKMEQRETAEFSKLNFGEMSTAIGTRYRTRA